MAYTPYHNLKKVMKWQENTKQQLFWEKEKQNLLTEAVCPLVKSALFFSKALGVSKEKLKSK